MYIGGADEFSGCIEIDNSGGTGFTDSSGGDGNIAIGGAVAAGC